MNLRKIRIIRGNRSQIRGIDFALAMIVFVLVMTQILVLTSNLISNTQVSFNIIKRDTQTNLVYNSVFNQAGTPSNWERTQTTNLLGTSWKFGMLHGNTISPTKVGRLSNSSLTQYYMDYNSLLGHVESSNKSFSISISSTINNTIYSVTVSGTNLIVTGKVTRNSIQGISKAAISLYGVSLSGATPVTVSSVGLTNSTGGYSLTLTGAIQSGFVQVVSIANVKGIGQDVDLYQYKANTNVNFLPAKSNVFENFNSSTSSVNFVMETHTGETLNSIEVLYTGQPGAVNTTSVSSASIVTTTNFHNASNVRVPPAGIVVFVAISSTGTNTGYVAVNVFPTTLDGKIAPVVQPTKLPPVPSSSITKIILIREVAFVVIVTVWE